MARKPGNGGSVSGEGNKSGARSLAVKVKSARGRKISSTRWLQRQLNDPYVAAAKRDGYRSRSAYKLIEIDEKYKLLRPRLSVVDLGAAPGGWSQVAAKRVRAGRGGGQVVAMDISPMEALTGVDVLHLDFLSDEAPDCLRGTLKTGRADLVMSDMAAPSTGHRKTDHLRIMALCETALYFAREVLTPGGVFLAKVLQGGTEHELLADMKRDFSRVRHVKPKASRADSSELYVLASGFRGP